MIIIQEVNDYALPRLAVPSLMERLGVMPAVVVAGARQTGKSTMVQELIPGPRSFFSLDDLDALDLARRNPGEILAGGGPVTIDEVQKAPDLLPEVKRAIDRDPRPGRFLLTGSANLLLMSQISESLAGRASYLTLWPMTHREQQGAGRGGIWEELLQSDSEDWPVLLAAGPDEPQDWRQLALRGGFPRPALRLDDSSERDIWFDGYVRTYLERDLSDISSVAALHDFRRLMRMTCLRIGQLVNQTELSRDAALTQPTVHRLPQPVGNLLHAGAPSRLRRQSHQAADQIPQGVLGGHRFGVVFSRRATSRGAPGEHRAEQHAGLAGRPSRTGGYFPLAHRVRRRSGFRNRGGRRPATGGSEILRPSPAAGRGTHKNLPFRIR